MTGKPPIGSSCASPWGAEVKKVNYEAEDTPYVGHITYVQRVFTCVAPTKQAALLGPYTEKRRIHP